MQLVTFTCSPEEALDESYLLLEIKKQLNLPSKKNLFFRWKKRSLDARNRNIKVNCSFEVSEEPLPQLLPDFDFKNVNNLGIVYDESKHTNFLEKVPKEYIK